MSPSYVSSAIWQIFSKLIFYNLFHDPVDNQKMGKKPENIWNKGMCFLYFTRLPCDNYFIASMKLVWGDHQKYSRFAYKNRPQNNLKNPSPRVGENPGYLREPKWQNPCTWKWERVKNLICMKYHWLGVKIQVRYWKFARQRKSRFLEQMYLAI